MFWLVLAMVQRYLESTFFCPVSTCFVGMSIFLPIFFCVCIECASLAHCSWHSHTEPSGPPSRALAESMHVAALQWKEAEARPGPVMPLGQRLLTFTPGASPTQRSTHLRPFGVSVVDINLFVTSR